MDFTNKIVVITGASSGMGKEMARLLHAKGAYVFMLARSIEKLKKLEKEMLNSFAIKCDVSDYVSVRKAFAKIRRKAKNIDIMISNAGIGFFGSLEKQTLKEIRSQIETNFFGTVYCIKEALPLMQKGSHIVNVSSVLGKSGFPGMAPYVASKFAVTGLTESLHHELHSRKIMVHGVYPAGVKTNFFDSKSFDHYLKNLHPEIWISSAKAAAAIIRGIERNKQEIYVPWYVGPYLKLRSLFHSLSMRLERMFYGSRLQ